MPIQELLSGPNPAHDDVQQTAFSYDVIGRYICNNWQEVMAAQGAGAYPFDAVVIGAGMFGAIVPINFTGSEMVLHCGFSYSTLAFACSNHIFKICHNN